MYIRGKKSPSPFAYHQHKTLQCHATGNNNFSKLPRKCKCLASGDNFKHQAKSRKIRQNKEAQIINHTLLVYFLQS